MTAGMTIPQPEPTEIAIVGMACRFPGAATVAEFWRNLRDGVETIRDFTDEELLARGVPPELVGNPSYVKRGVVLDGIETFDAALFGYSPQEAALLDPQNRLFLECAWEALESAGYGAESDTRDVGVFAGAGVNTYFLNNLAGNAEILDRFGSFQVMLGNDKDYLATLVSYKLNLTGPSVTVQTACSTSLVAIHMACQSLLNGECDMALAGGVALSTPQDGGYLHQEGMILSPDGRCRPFDAQAAGTLNGAGAGVVLLQPLAQALAQGSTILGIVKGSAVNNDGARKVGYTAPGPEGQARVIAEALDIAGIHPDQVGYVEAHGTATPLGDPIEFTALTKAFRARTDRIGACAVGSLKSNMGHAGAAAGVAGVIKAALCLGHRQIPPTLHFQAPNPALGLEDSPFFVNDRLIDWTAEPGSRVAAVSSFGIGGTNAHLVLAENRFAETAPPSPGERWRILPLSARAPEALAPMAASLSAYLGASAVDPADAAHTLQTGRKAFDHRAFALGRTSEELRRALDAGPAALAAKPGRGVAFLLTGHGGQSVGMTRRLCETQPVFREALRERAAALEARTGLDALAVLHPAPGREEWAEGQLRRMDVSQPVMFIVQMALARLWRSWGVEPQSVIGHSSGEYAAACLAGILSEEDALALVAARGRLMDTTAPGGMVALRNSESEIRPFLNDRLSLAVVNAHDMCVVSGHEDALQALQARLAGIGVDSRRLHVSRAAHSCTMDSILPAFAEAAAAVTFHPPRLPYVSGMTGERVDATVVSRPEYWVRHLREAVRFADGIGRVLEDPDALLLEIGPGNALGTFAKAHPSADPARPVVASLPHPQQDAEEEDAFLARSLARLWQAGVAVDWEAHGAGEKRRKVPLPTYPFQRRRCWIDPQEPTALPSATARIRRKTDPADWFLAPVWRRSPPLSGPSGTGPEHVLLFAGPDGLGEGLAAHLEIRGSAVTRVRPGDSYAPPDAGIATLRPDSPEDYRRLLADLGTVPRTILHAWSLIQPADALDEAQTVIERRLGFHSLCLLGKALGAGGAVHDLTVLTSGLHDVTGDEILCPEKSLIAGPAMVIPQEYPTLRTHLIDLIPPAPGGAREAALFDRIHAELTGDGRPARLSLRGAHRWLPAYTPQRLDTAGPQRRALRPNGVYLITGGLGGLGLEIAGHLAREAQARLALVGRTAYPPRAEWEGWIAAHGPDDPTRRVLERLLGFEAAGAELRLFAADAGRLDSMEAVFAALDAEWGTLHGVVHAAGAIGATTHRTLDEYDPAQCAEQFAPKPDGVRVLDRLLRGRDVDFCVLMSSMASVLGGLGFAAYAAANAALDTAAQRAEQRIPGRWIAMNWDSWQVRADDDGRGPGQLLRALEMSAAEGLDAFLRVLHHATAAQTLVTRGDLEPRLRQWIDLPPRADLPAPDTLPAPETGDVQGGLATVWRALLGHERIGPEDNFFDLGGHSLLATQVLAQIRHRFGVSLPMGALFRAPTLRALAEAVETAMAAPAETTERRTESGIPRRPADEPAVLSWPQQQLWVVDRMLPGTAAYNVPLALRLTGRLDRAALGRALDEIVRRHEALRTRFPSQGARPHQEIAPPAPVPLPVVSLRHLDGEALASAGKERLDAESSRPFDLAAGPPLRACLLETGAEEHIFLIVMHHIVTDGWSIALFMKELVALYEAFTRGQPSPLPEPAVQYADFAHWQRNALDDGALAGQLAYWRERLDGLPERHGLLGDFPPPEPRTFASATVTLPLGGDLARRVRAFAQGEGATPFMVLLAAFHALLFRHTGIDDQAVAVSVANRTRHWQEEIFGFFVNILVLRARPRPETGFRALVEEVRRTALEAYANQDLPFATLVEALRPQRRPDRHPLAQIGFVLQNLPYDSRPPDGLEIAFVEAGKNASPFDLVCSITEVGTEAGEDLVLSLEYATDLFRRDSVERMAVHYRTLLDGAVGAPDTALARLPLLPAGEMRDILERWSRDPAPTPAGLDPLPPPEPSCQSIVALFESIAAGRPDATALRFGGQAIGYAALKADAERLAAHLAGLGLPREAPVCVALPRGPELVVAFLGILKAGLAYAPLDPAAPPARQQGILEDLHHPPTLTAALVADILSGPPGPTPDVTVEPGDLAYIIHTSGSTGRPKGTMLTHGGLLALALEQRRLLGAGPGDRVLQLASSGFDASVWEFVMALGSGAELVMAPAGELMPGPGLTQLLHDRRITHLTITPSALAALPPRRLPDLKVLVAAGAALPADLVRRWAEGRVFINAYGPTETTVCATLGVCDSGASGKPTIGRPLEGWSVFVLDEQGNPVPDGVAGELHIGGAGLARGYWERPELTTQRFFDHTPTGERLYATGDRVVFRRGDGDAPAAIAPATIEFLGRLDEQIKLRGFRVEPGEVEAHLRRHPAVAQAAVVGHPQRDPTDLAAYLVPRDGVATDGLAARLRGDLAAALPDWMVPGFFVTLDSLPLTASGKIDHGRLPDPRGAFADSGYRAPRAGVEADLCALWEEVLGVAPIGVDTGFFDAGGTSLRAVELLARIERRFGVALPIARLFRHPTVAALAGPLAALVRGEGEREPWSPLVPLAEGGDGRPCFWFPGAGGSVLSFAPLARRLGDARPVYGLQPAGLDGLAPPDPDMDGMAARAVAAIRTAQPAGPYRLGGHSFGAKLAFAAAQHLLRDGEAVELLTVLDGYAPGPNPLAEAGTREDGVWLAAVVEELAAAAGRSLSIGPDRFAGLDAETALDQALALLRESHVPDIGRAALRGMARVMRSCAAMDYDPPDARPVPVLLLRAEETLNRPDRHRLPAALAGDDLGWERYSDGPPTVRTVPGNHFAVLDASSARILEECWNALDLEGLCVAEG